MKALSPEVRALLGKLYNLRGEDSVVLVEMDKQKSIAENTKERTTSQKKQLQDKIADLEKQHEELEAQGEKLINLLSGIDRDAYATVLDRLKIDFDPEGLVSKLNKSLPRTIENVVLDTKKAEDELVKVEEEMNSAITKIDELAIRRDTALANQEKLNEYFDLALSGSINITRDSITSLLEQFDFSEEEQREAAKILMFPEDALFSYDESVKSKTNSVRKNDEMEEEVITEPVREYPEEKENVAFKVEPEEPTKVEIDREVEDENPKEDLIELLRSNGVNYLDFTAQDMDYLIDHYDAAVINKNIGFVKSLNVNTDMFVNHASLLTDNEFTEKVSMLLNIGKENIDIYLNPNVLEKYSKENLAGAISMLKESGMDPKNVPLMAY